jgi:hypothetical protein
MRGMMNLGGPDDHEVKRGERLVGEVAPILDAQLKGTQWVLVIAANASRAGNQSLP